MRAIAIQAHGGLDQIKLHADWPEPTAGPGQAVVAVKACGLNYLDIFVLHGMPGLPVEMPRIPGGDIAGVVHSVGAGVSRDWIGKRVLVDPHIKHGGALGEHGNGGLCERITVDADNLIAMPDAVTFEQAASLPIAYGTAYRMLVTRSHVPLASTLRACDGTSTASAGPTATMRSPSTSTVLFGCCAPLRTSMSVPPVSAISSLTRRTPAERLPSTHATSGRARPSAPLRSFGQNMSSMIWPSID